MHATMSVKLSCHWSAHRYGYPLLFPLRALCFICHVSVPLDHSRLIKQV